MNTHSPRLMGPLNSHILDTLSVAYTAALDLAGRGYTLIDVRIGQRRPVIEIQHTRRCEELGGGMRMIHGSNGQRTETHACVYRGAQVEWRETP